MSSGSEGLLVRVSWERRNGSGLSHGCFSELLLKTEIHRLSGLKELLQIWATTWYLNPSNHTPGMCLSVCPWIPLVIKNLLLLRVSPFYLWITLIRVFLGAKLFTSFVKQNRWGTPEPKVLQGTTEAATESSLQSWR